MINERLVDIRRRLGNQDVILVGVVKYASLADIQKAVDLGVLDLGFNYTKYAEEILPDLPNSVVPHFIGHLQSNKIKKAVEIFNLIQSVDSHKIAKKIDKEARDQNREIDALIQIKTDPKKHYGLQPDEISAFIEECVHLKNIKIRGLMTIGPFLKNPEDMRPTFSLMKRMFEEIKQKDYKNIQMDYLSMGMSEDYEIAITEGSNMIRIGSSIFS
ncbi:MAG: YggS family pyridoxal phosphate-dependent enzyme [Candidatus Altiarchaeota archaeon]